MTDWWRDSDNRNGVALLIPCVGALVNARESWCRGWRLITLMFCSVAVFMGSRAALRFASYNVPNWATLQSPLIEATAWAMGATMIAVAIVLRRGWYRRL